MYVIVLTLILISTFLFVANDDAFLHRNYTFLKCIYDFSVMGNYKNGRSALINFLKQFHNFKRVLRVKVSGRLIGKQNVWTVYKCSCKCHPLLFSTGELVRTRFIFLCKAYQSQYFRHSFFNHTCRFFNYPLCKCHVFINISVFEQTEILEYNSNSSAVFLRPFRVLTYLMHSHLL